MTELEQEIAHLQELRAKHYKNIRRLEEQLASYGMDRPLPMLNNLKFEREQLRQVEARLKELTTRTEPEETLAEPEEVGREEKPAVWGWWVAALVVVVLATVIFLLIQCNEPLTTQVPSTSTPELFHYSVRVQAKETREYVEDATVTIEVSGKAPLDGKTDSKGFVRIVIPSSHAGQPGRLIVEAKGYKRRTQEIDLIEGALPDILSLEPEVVLPSPTPTNTPCDLKPVDFDFESKTNEGWDIRWEGSDRLGIDARPDEGHYCGSGHCSLAFRFELREAPFDKAQIKYEALNFELTEELAGWVYLPSNAPNDLQASCFILEDNTGGQWPGKPEWPWYQTGYTLLQPSQWTLVRCLATNFVSTNYSAGHWDEPLLVGFEFTRKSKGSYEGTVYLDKVILR